jgi:NAD(P)-dependent dehydrogenase (short-subunit alcohol dehydrogenase family)
MSTISLVTGANRGIGLVTSTSAVSLHPDPGD